MATFCCMPRLICDRASDPLGADAQTFQDRQGVAPGHGTIDAVEPGCEDQVLHRTELLEEGRVHAHPVDQALDRHLVALAVLA